MPVFIVNGLCRADDADTRSQLNDFRTAFTGFNNIQCKALGQDVVTDHLANMVTEIIHLFDAHNKLAPRVDELDETVFVGNENFILQKVEQPF